MYFLMAKKKYYALGGYLKDKREALGFTQRDVSDFLGYKSPQFVSNVERGLCQLPLKAVRKLITFYKLEAKEVYDILLCEQEQVLRSALLKRSGPKLDSRGA